MYLPYFRGKQYELAAISELPSILYSTEKVLPIIEPVTFERTKSGFDRIKKKNIPFVLIINPSVGAIKSIKPHHLINKTLVFGTFKDSDKCILGYIINPSTSLDHIEKFLNEYPDNNKVFIHGFPTDEASEFNQLISKDKAVKYNIFFKDRGNEKYVKSFTKIPKVLIQDGFVKQKRNADYPSHDEFHDLCYNYKNLGFSGFGDYHIVGKNYEDTKGAMARVVAIHLTYKKENKILVKHFLSTENEDTDVAGKYSQAVTTLIDFVETNKIKHTAGIREFIDHVELFPNLGNVKKYSMLHHTEFMSEFA